MTIHSSDGHNVWLVAYDFINLIFFLEKEEEAVKVKADIVTGKLVVFGL